jgi:regulator of protease activity HflC (stomatin/prohibitin superfamily)
VLRYFKGGPSEYIIEHVRGRVIREGKGLGFFYMPTTASIVSIPLSSLDTEFVFDEATSDFQTVTIAGQASYRVAEPAKLAAALDFTIDPASGKYRTEDPAKLASRIGHVIQEALHIEVQRLPLESVLRRRAQLAKSALARARQNQDPGSLGIEVQNVFLTGISPAPEVAKALEADRKEIIMAKADRATFQRKMVAVEHQRKMLGSEDGPTSTIECDESCPFSRLCEDYQKHVNEGKAWCPLFREFSR